MPACAGLTAYPSHNDLLATIFKRLIDRDAKYIPPAEQAAGKGLIKKDRNLNDQRVVYVKLTPEGAKLKKQARQIIDALKLNLDVSQADQLNDLLDQMRK